MGGVSKMKTKKTLLAVALAGASLNAHAIETIMLVTGGSFGMGFFTSGGSIPFASIGSGGADITDQYNLPGWDTTLVQRGAAPGTIGAFAFGSDSLGPVWVNTYTAPTATQSGIYGGGPFPVFNGSLTNGGVFTMDMSSFFFNWNGAELNQGNAAASGMLSGCTATGCNFTLGWQSLIVGGPFKGNTGTWTLTGCIPAAVDPVCAPIELRSALALIGSFSIASIDSIPLVKLLIAESNLRVICV